MIELTEFFASPASKVMLTGVLAMIIAVSLIRCLEYQISDIRKLNAGEITEQQYCLNQKDNQPAARCLKYFLPSNK